MHFEAEAWHARFVLERQFGSNYPVSIGTASAMR